MFSDKITYEDFNGNTQTKEVFFNLSKMEALALDSEGPEGYAKKLQAVADEGDMIQILDAFKDIVKKAYGVKSEDGKRFIKSDEEFAKFEESPAYDEFMMKLITEEDYALDFILGALPSVEGVTKDSVLKDVKLANMLGTGDNN